MRMFNYQGKEIVGDLPPEAVALIPPDIAVALMGVTDDRGGRSWWFVVTFLCTAFFALVLTQSDMTSFQVFGWIGVIAGIIFFVWDLRFSPQWRVDVLRRGKWQFARLEQKRYLAKQIANEIRTAIRSDNSEYVFPQG